MFASFVPIVDGVWPPGTKIRPSGKAACPAQNRSVTLLGTGVKLFAPGSHTCAPVPESSKANTFPVCMRTALTATIGQLNGAAHWPICAASVVFETVTATPVAVARSEEHTSELQSRLHLVCR